MFAHPLLVMVYAPAGQSRWASERLTGLTTAATGAGFVVAYADHLQLSIPAIEQLGAIPDLVAKDWFIDQKRVYATGHSDGGTASLALAVLDPWTVDVRINGEAIAQQTSASPANTFTYYGVGNGNATTTVTMFADDIAFRDASANLSFLGGGAVYGLLPGSDGTHSFTAGDFLYETGSSVSTTATDVYNHLRDQLDTTAGNFITQAVTNGSGWVTVNFENLPVSPTIVNGLEVVTGFHSAGTAGNNIQLVLALDAASDTIFQADFSETTLLFPSRHRSVRPTGGDWTESDVNNTYVRLGMSSDANPDIHCDGIRREVDTAYAPTIALNTADAHSFSTTTPTVEFTGSDSDGDTLSYDVRIRTKTGDDRDVTRELEPVTQHQIQRERAVHEIGRAAADLDVHAVEDERRDSFVADDA